MSVLKVIITGSPRSGTSFLAGLVCRMGFHPGPEKWLKNPDEHNPHGYFECMPLMKISMKILEKLGGDFHRLPSFGPACRGHCEDEKRDIARIVEAGGIEMYKGNRLMVLADLYDELFPEAKWIFVQRTVEETYRSRFGDKMPFEEWKTISDSRLRRWQASKPSARALTVDYADFGSDLARCVGEIERFLGVALTAEQRNACIDFYQPRQRSLQRSSRSEDG